MITSHNKVDAAKKQLEMAIALYIGGFDKFSCITLASAADSVFGQVLANQGKEAFLDHAVRRDTETSGEQKSRGELGKEMNLVLRVNALKHLDPSASEYVEMDLNGCALAAISKAVSNHIFLIGREEYYITAFLGWVQNNLPPELLP